MKSHNVTETPSFHPADETTQPNTSRPLHSSGTGGGVERRPAAAEPLVLREDLDQSRQRRTFTAIKVATRVSGTGVVRSAGPELHSLATSCCEAGPVHFELHRAADAANTL